TSGGPCSSAAGSGSSGRWANPRAGRSSPTGSASGSSAGGAGRGGLAGWVESSTPRSRASSFHGSSWNGSGMRGGLVCGGGRGGQAGEQADEEFAERLLQARPRRKEVERGHPWPPERDRTTGVSDGRIRDGWGLGRRRGGKPRGSPGVGGASRGVYPRGP